MHASVMEWGQRVIAPAMVTGKDVLEAGSYDVNGSLRGHVMSLGPASYLGIDIRPGPGVDRVCPAEHAYAEMGVGPPAGGHGAFDLIVCTEMLEHCLEWQLALRSLTQCLRMDGWLVLSTRAPGFPRHEHPEDHWRFSVQIMSEAFAAMNGPVTRCYDPLSIGSDPDPSSPGTLVLGRRCPGWPNLIEVEAVAA